jgi:hypothetical protein
MELSVFDCGCLDCVVGDSRLIRCIMQLYLFFNHRVFVATLYISLGVTVHFTNPFKLSNPLGDADYVAVWINKYSL